MSGGSFAVTVRAGKPCKKCGALKAQGTVAQWGEGKGEMIHYPSCPTTPPAPSSAPSPAPTPPPQLEQWVTCEEEVTVMLPVHASVPVGGTVQRRVARKLSARVAVGESWSLKMEAIGEMVHKIVEEAVRKE